MDSPKPVSLECPSFFKVMIGDFTTTLGILPKSEKHLRESNVRGSVVIRSSRGRQWRIKTGIVHGRRLYFQDGWERFISADSIPHGDFLIFFYDEDFGFDVIIYDTTRCEAAEHVSVTNETVKIEVESEDSDEGESCVIKRSVSRKRKVKIN